MDTLSGEPGGAFSGRRPTIPASGSAVSPRAPEQLEHDCTYAEAHRRIYAARGKASQWRCIRCGAPAEQWAYRAGSSREVEGTTAHHSRRAPSRATWSPDPADYDPLCVPCHGKATRPDWGQGYRHDPELAAERRREWRRRSYEKQTSTPEGRQAYRDRKNRERRERRARRHSNEDTTKGTTP